MKKFGLGLLTGLAVSVVFSVGTVDGATDVWGQIEAGNAALAAAIASGDPAQSAACYTSDGQILPPGSASISGADAVGAFWAAAKQGGVGSVNLTTLEVEQHGDTAIEVGSAEIRDADGNMLDNGKYIVVWKLDGGIWKLHRDIWNSNGSE